MRAPFSGKLAFSASTSAGIPETAQHHIHEGQGYHQGQISSWGKSIHSTDLHQLRIWIYSIRRAILIQLNSMTFYWHGNLSAYPLGVCRGKYNAPNQGPLCIWGFPSPHNKYIRHGGGGLSVNVHRKELSTAQPRNEQLSSVPG